MSSDRNNQSSLDLELARALLCRFDGERSSNDEHTLHTIQHIWESLDAVAAEPELLEESLRLFKAFRGRVPYAHLTSIVAAALDIEPEAALAQLEVIESPSVWEAAPFEGVQLYHVQGGPDVADAITGYVRLPPNTEFPHHEHAGDEYIVLLDGVIEGSDGAILHPGWVHSMAAGTAHSVRSGAEGALYLAVVHRGIVVNGHFLGADDPAI